MRIAICDDDPMELQRIKSAAEQFASPGQMEAEVTVDAFPAADNLLRSVKKHGGFDLMILDILMPGMNGIELAREIRDAGDGGRIIFLTSSPEYAVDSYKVNAFYYLLKPWQEAELVSLIGRALLDAGEESAGSIAVKAKGRLARLRFGAIRYVESVNHNVHFHMRDDGVVDCFGSLNEFQDALLCDRRFVKCHKSFLVNMDCVASITGKEFVLAGNQIIPISRNIYRDVKSAYFDYFFKKGLVKPQ